VKEKMVAECGVAPRRAIVKKKTAGRRSVSGTLMESQFRGGAVTGTEVDVVKNKNQILWRWG